MNRFHHPSIAAPLLALALFAISASSAGAFPFVPGIEAGAGRTGIAYDEELPIWDNGMTNSFTAGLRLESPPRARFGLVTGVRFTHVGNHAKFKPDLSFFGDVRGWFGMSLDEVRIPVLVRVAPVRASGLRVTLGPEVAFVAGAHSVVKSGSGSSPILENKWDILGDVRRTRLDARVGLGWTRPLGKHDAFAELRATRAILDAGLEDHWFSKWYPYDIALVIGLDR